jgi:hypothetical protein
MGVLVALDQRIATRYQLAPMDLAESAPYLRHHLALVNNAAIAVIAAATAGKALVDDDCARKAVAELARDYRLRLSRARAPLARRRRLMSRVRTPLATDSLLVVHEGEECELALGTLPLPRNGRSLRSWCGARRPAPGPLVA